MDHCKGGIMDKVGIQTILNIKSYFHEGIPEECETLRESFF